MNEKTKQDNRTLIDFWSGALSVPKEEMEAALGEGLSVEQLAPSEKLVEAAKTLGSRKKVLDYGCGHGWAGIIAAKSGSLSVILADPAPGAAAAAEAFAKLFGAEERAHAECIPTDWLMTEPENSFDGVFCSNVLDVVPPETADEIISGLARVAAKGASVIIGLNYYLSPEAAAEKGIALEDGVKLYQDGVLRLVSRSDEEWAAVLGKRFIVDKLVHFAWPGETAERRRLFYLIKE